MQGRRELTDTAKNKKKTKRPITGNTRKGKYEIWLKEDKLLLLEAWARDGFTDEEIAGKMEIAYSTLREWKKKYHQFEVALKKGKEVADVEIENSLFKRAKGYTVEIKKTFKVKRSEYDKETGKKTADFEELVEGKDEVHVPADTTAIMFWLRNRKPDTWRNKPPELDEIEDTDEIEREIYGEEKT